LHVLLRQIGRVCWRRMDGVRCCVRH
jgi:hypothetical protein